MDERETYELARRKRCAERELRDRTYTRKEARALVSALFAGERVDLPPALRKRLQPWL